MAGKGIQQARPGNLNAEKHGGAGAIKRIKSGEEFRGVAADAEHNVHDELEQSGLLAILRKRAERVQAAADIHWALMMGAADAGALKTYEMHAKTYAWLEGLAGRKWAEYNRLAETMDTSDEVDVVAKYKVELLPGGGDNMTPPSNLESDKDGEHASNH